MPASTQSTTSFPAARIPSSSGGLPIEVTLIAQLGHGAGDALHHQTGMRQQGHANFIDAFDEPSARLGDANFAHGDASTLFSFGVGPKGHPFHRHAGNRMFTAISGSSGTQLRFSTASDVHMDASPHHFLDTLQQVAIPPDCLFTVRFGGGTWHQFVPLREGSSHPALFAVSCHANELAGIDDPALAALVAAGNADIPSMTETLPQAVIDFLHANPMAIANAPTVALSLDAPAGGLHSAICGGVRHLAGRLRAFVAGLRAAGGFISHRTNPVVELSKLPLGSLLAAQFNERHEHEDAFEMTLQRSQLQGVTAPALLADVLQGFLSNRPTGVFWLMQLRNVLVRPLRLRTSPLGCPVSSLLSPERCNLFLGKYPVLAQSLDSRALHAEVLLGADDRHLRFRSCVGVRMQGNEVRITLATRVQCRNWFGRAYMASISRMHRRYVSPAMLGMAAEHALAQTRSDAGLPVFGAHAVRNS